LSALPIPEPLIPADWAERTRRAKQRDRYTCQGCGASHRDHGFYDSEGRFIKLGSKSLEAAGYGPCPCYIDTPGGTVRVVRAQVKAVAIDGDRSNPDDGNIRTVCLRCNKREGN
jgi:hypothetical protein